MLWAIAEELLGLHTKELAVSQMALRALLVYVVSVTLVRLGNRRFLGKSTAFDFILAIILGSVISRAITGNAPFFPALVAAAVLVGVHWLMASLAFHFPGIGFLLKGKECLLVRDGHAQWEEMRRNHITESDLQEAARCSGKVESFQEVHEMRLERDGSMSIVRKQ